MSESEDVGCVGATILSIGAVVLGAVLLWAYGSFKAQSFANVTGQRVDWWDAIWLDLRVMEPVKDSKP